MATFRTQLNQIKNISETQDTKITLNRSVQNIPKQITFHPYQNSKRLPVSWCPQEDKVLTELVKLTGCKNWAYVSHVLHERFPKMQRRTVNQCY
jgi:hypothetical protein